MTQAFLHAGLQQIGISLDAERQDRLIAYRDLLQKWNRSFNLTAVRDPDEMVVLHLLDSLAVLPYLDGADDLRAIDIGTGGGLPGIPLAIARPRQHWVLLDSSHKKGSFLRQVAAELGLANVEVVVKRIEDFAPVSRLDLAVSRAFSSLEAFVSAAMRVLKPLGRMLAMKGMPPTREIESLRARGFALEVIPIVVPGLDAQRCLVAVEASSS